MAVFLYDVLQSRFSGVRGGMRMCILLRKGLLKPWKPDILTQFGKENAITDITAAPGLVSTMMSGSLSTERPNASRSPGFEQFTDRASFIRTLRERLCLSLLLTSSISSPPAPDKAELRKPKLKTYSGWAIDRALQCKHSTKVCDMSNVYPWMLLWTI